MRIVPPNHTQTPNELFDHWLPHLSESELKVLLVIFRKTFGWHKNRDKISISQLMTLTGLGRDAVINAGKTLHQKGIILREVIGPNGKQETYFELVIEEDSNNSDQSEFPTGTSRNNRPPPVGISDPQKKSLKEKEKEINNPQPPSNSGSQKPKSDSVVEEKKSFSSETIKYKTPGGKEKSIEAAEIYAHFLKSNFKTEVIAEAIQIVKLKQEPIGNILKLLESVCFSLVEKHTPSIKSPKQREKLSWEDMPKSTAKGRGFTQQEVDEMMNGHLPKT